jgi:hypothetical protein
MPIYDADTSLYAIVHYNGGGYNPQLRITSYHDIDGILTLTIDHIDLTGINKTIAQSVLTVSTVGSEWNYLSNVYTHFE